jgi:hypothetical protein
MNKNRFSKRARRAPKTILRLPDLDHAKAAVLNSLTCPEAQRGCGCRLHGVCLLRLTGGGSELE